MSPLDPEAKRRAGDRCRKCQEEILWAATPAGKAVPIEPEPVYGGNVALEVDEVGMLRARVVRPAGDVAAYVTHFTTCPAAEFFRKPTESAPQPVSAEEGEAKLAALQMRMPFGKYAGQTLEEIDRDKRGHAYLRWAAQNLDFRNAQLGAAVRLIAGLE